jgi:hypothetical protein
VDYFRDDVIPALERQQKNYVIVDTNWPPLTVFAPRPQLTDVGPCRESLQQQSQGSP